jgi:hypothetical protein
MVAKVQLLPFFVFLLHFFGIAFDQKSCSDMKWIISFGKTKWTQGKGITIRPFCFALKTP